MYIHEDIFSYASLIFDFLSFETCHRANRNPTCIVSSAVKGSMVGIGVQYIQWSDQLFSKRRCNLRRIFAYTFAYFGILHCAYTIFQMNAI